MYQNQNPALVDRFEDWWRRDNKGLPLMRVIARRDDACCPEPVPRSTEAKYTDPDFLHARQMAAIRNNVYLADAYASLGANFGPGSLALYLGSEPRFTENTVWFEPCIQTLETLPHIGFDPDNKWWKKHLNLIRTLRELAGDDYLVDMPDLVENIDILAAMRGPQETLFDLMDEPENVERAIGEIDNVYFRYFDEMHEAIVRPDGVSSYTAFCVLGRGRVAKLQCDFSAMISPDQFCRFVLPSLKKQTLRLDHSIYHLDGPDAIRHVPALMEIERLDALQWTCGAGQPDGACKKWYGIYDQVSAAKKNLWIQIYDGDIDQWIRSADSIIERYGKKSLYLIFPGMSMKEADRLMNYAHSHWE